MKIKTIELRQIAIPLNFTFSQSNNAGTDTSNSVIIQLINDQNISGFGECCPRSYVTGESVESVISDTTKIQSTLYSTTASNFSDWSSILDQLEIGNSTKCALELAWLDMWSKQLQKTLPELLNTPLPNTFQYSLVLPLLPLRALQKLGHRIKVFQPYSIKLKVDQDVSAHLSKINYIRTLFDSDCPVRLDINGGWSLVDAQKMIPKYINNGVNSFEQPLAVSDIQGMQELIKTYGDSCTLMIDESLLSFESAQQYIDQKACNHFNLKLSKLGGISDSLKIYDLAKEANISCQLGAHFGESSLLSAAGLLLASLTTNLSNLEGGLGTILLKEDLSIHPVQQDISGNIYLEQYFKKPGLIPEMNMKVLDKYTLASKSWNNTSV